MPETGTEFCPDDEDKLYEHHSVFASDMEWVPVGYQEHKYAEPIRPVYEEILIAKMRPG
jgi:DNA-directed RNA polymerase I and III subunit RPAC1